MKRVTTRILKLIVGLPTALVGVVFGAALVWEAALLIWSAPHAAVAAWDTFSADNTLDGEGAGQHWWDLAGIVADPIGHVLAAVIVGALGGIVLLVGLVVLCWAFGIDRSSGKGQPVEDAAPPVLTLVKRGGEAS
jgi:hypothetical protein